METKTCTKCGLEKPLTEFNFKNKKKNILQSMCKECLRERQRYLYNTVYKYKNSEKYKNNRRRRREEVGKMLCELKSGGCVVCGEKDVCCLDFHHLYDKSFNLASAREVSTERIEEEIKKMYSLMCKLSQKTSCW